MNIDNVNIVPGDMRERISIESATVTQNSYGEGSNAWATITDGTRWAEFKTLSGRELQVAQGINSEITCAFILRYIADITPRHRVLYRGRYFDINAVLNVNERRIKTVLLCSENT